MSAAGKERLTWSSFNSKGPRCAQSGGDPTVPANCLLRLPEQPRTQNSEQYGQQEMRFKPMTHQTLWSKQAPKLITSSAAGQSRFMICVHTSPVARCTDLENNRLANQESHPEMHNTKRKPRYTTELAQQINQEISKRSLVMGLQTQENGDFVLCSLQTSTKTNRHESNPVISLNHRSKTDALGWQPVWPTIPKSQYLTSWEWVSKIYFSYKKPL